MGIKFNVFTGQFDIAGGSSGSVAAADVSVTPVGNLTSTNVQDALEEHQDDIDALVQTDIDFKALQNAQQIFVDNIAGDDTLGSGAFLNPVQTLHKAVTLVTNPAVQYVFILGPGDYSGIPLAIPGNVSIVGDEASVSADLTLDVAPGDEIAPIYSGVSFTNFTMDLSPANTALPVFLNAGFSITRLDATTGAHFIQIRDGSINDLVTSGNVAVNNVLFTGSCTVQDGGTAILNGCVVGINIDVFGAGSVSLTACTFSGTITGTTVLLNTPTVLADSSSLSFGGTTPGCTLNFADNAATIGYSPATPGNWSPVPSTVKEALDTVVDNLNDHIVDAADAHDASAISNIPAGNLAATDVQGALNELQSDIDGRALDSAVIKKDGSVDFTADQSMGGFKLTNLATPVASSDAANKNYVDSVAEGLKPKAAVRVATTVAGTLSTSFEDADVIDGITLATGDRILIKDQAAPAENGIYIVQASGAPVRSTDFDSLTPIDEINGSMVAVQLGTANAGKIFVQSGVVAVLNTDPINFIFFNSISGLVGGDGITVSGSNISVDHDGEGLTFVANQLALELDGSTLSKSASGIKLSDTAVTPATIGSASETVTITVDQQGRLTAASEQSISITASQVSDFDEAAQDAVGSIVVDSADIDFTYNDATPSITGVLTTTGVVAATYGSATNVPQIIVDSKGRISSVTDIAITATDELVKVSANDTTAGYLEDKVVGGSGISIATLNDGADEDLQINLDINGLTAETVVASGDLIAIYDVSASANRKMTRANFLGGSAGDISETSFSFANNQVTPDDVINLSFANGVVRSFEAQVSVALDATTDLFEEFEISGIQKGASWNISVESVGDLSGILFTITNAGQVQYTSENKAGFVLGTMKFRAQVTGV